MTPRQAAAVIGCTANQVRHLIRSGRIKARRIESETFGFSYEVSPGEAERYRDSEQSKGFPRGAKRNGLRGTKQGKE